MSNYKENSFYHDYETSGADTQRDRPTQFAGIRVDGDLNEIEVFNSIYCKMQDDCLPQPMAFLVTRMMVSDVEERGLPEFEFANLVLEQFSKDNTTVLGYNTINFDDEITRNMFHRNLINPYDREWKNGNSRWDIINVVRLASAVFGRKDYNGEKIFNVSLNDEGKKSFRLENLSVANNIEHENAHDALSDVYATIGMSKKILEKERDFFKKMESRRVKNNVQNDLMDVEGLKPVLFCSPFFGSEKSFVGFIIPICLSRHNKNEVYCLKIDSVERLKDILEFEASEIKELLYSSKSELDDIGMERPPITSVKINACPVYLTMSDIKNIFSEDGAVDEFYSNIGVDSVSLRESFIFIRDNVKALRDKVSKVFEEQIFSDGKRDVDLSIYSGGFPSRSISDLKFSFNKELLKAIDDDKDSGNNDSKLSVFKKFLNLGDDDFGEQVFRVAFRSYPETAFNLGEDYVRKWNEHCYSRIHNENEAASINYIDFLSEIKRLKCDDKYSDDESQSILADLERYGRNISLKYMDLNSII